MRRASFLFLFFLAGFSFAQESARFLQDLIRINTTNPPGNEMAAARYLAKIFQKEGVAYQIFESAPGRGSIAARIPGEMDTAPLCLLSHLDVVAPGEGWSVPPFSGKRIEGAIWGRGAVDMKGMTAMELSAFLHIARLKKRPKQDILFLATADEERGGALGVEYLLKNFYPEVRCGTVWNEGAEGLEFLGQKIIPVQVGEKSIVWLKLIARGEEGHASVPKQNNPVQRLIEAIHRVLQIPRPATATKAMERMFKVLLEEVPLLRQLVGDPFSEKGFQKLYEIVSETSQRTADHFYALTHDTISPTMLKAGIQTNVIPSEAEAELDIRLLPDEDVKAFLEKVKRAIADPQIEVKVLLTSHSPETPTDTPFYKALERVLRSHYPEAVVVPTISAGGSDSRFYRAKGAFAYGLIPVILPDAIRFSLHAKDERMPVVALKEGEEVIFEVLRALSF